MTRFARHASNLASLSRWPLYWRLMRFDKPIGILLLLWPALWALWLAGKGFPGILPLFVIVMGVLLTRAAGCVINDYADRKFDPHVERTRLRPIAAGEVEPEEALLLFAILVVMALLLVMLSNRLTMMLAIPGGLLAASYPFMKRYTYWPQAYLGLAFGWAVPMSFSAVLNHIPGIAWEIYAATILWALIYDTMYAIVDREDDLKIGVKSTAILFGRHDRQIIAMLQLLMLALLWDAGQRAGLDWRMSLGVCGALVLFAYQQWLIRHHDREGCFRAFLNNHWVGAGVFAGIALSYR